MKKCKQGYYYCYDEKKCKKIPTGYRVGLGGWLRKEKEEEKSEDSSETESKKNGNGNGNGGNGGNGDGGAVSEGWSEKYKKSIDCDNPKGFSQRAHCQGRKKVNEATMSPAQKRKDTMLKKKYDKSDMKQNMIDQYGKEEGTKIYFATIRKQAMKEESNPRIPRKDGQPANSKKHSDLYTDENPKGTIHGLGFKDVATAKASVAKIKKSSRSHAHKIQAAIAMEQRARVMGKTSEAAVYRKFINSMKKKTKKMNEAKEKGDHEVAMAQTQLKKSEENIKKLRKALGTKEKDIPAWVQAKITDTEHNTDAASSYMDEGKRDGKSAKDKGYSLRDWFKGGGWVQAGGKYDGKPCAKQPGQKTKPFCRDADDRASMSKKERNRRAAKKRREDPNPNRKGKAKMVTDDYSNWRQELELSEEGKKDACYHKVKSRYSVWPSAYASGALVKCRKVGAKNWGNKTKKESYEYSNWRDDFIPTDYETTDLITPDPIQVPPSNLQKIEEAKKCWKGYKKVGTQKLFGKTYNRCEKIKKEEFSSWRDEISEVHRPPAGWKPYGGREKGPVPEVDATAKRIDAIRKSIKTVKEDWQKANRKDGVDGMSQSSVDAYKRENPGSKLKTAVTGKVKKGSKDAKRRKSFCARSDGQRKMHNIDCSKTPDKKICKARKRWRC